ncbi:hypothetical protein ABZS66_11170 [Dactylosporangium sp. NPDC005572]|uniref:hypothetical protein n=1 Tax=Dactylosporangium sp. NPDC005572 TaxID=3156889 RepID=UPI0033B3D743
MEDWFDIALLWLAGAAALVVLCACTFDAGWINPSEQGTGPFVTPERIHTFHVVIWIAAAGCLLCLVRAWWGGTGLPLATAAVLAGIVAVFAMAIYFPRPRVELRAEGFAADRIDVATRGTLTFWNRTGADLVICLGLSGDCDTGAAGPADLRSPGLTVAPDHRVSAVMPKRAGDFRITLVNPAPGATRRDMVIRTYVESA